MNDEENSQPFDGDQAEPDGIEIDSINGEKTTSSELEELKKEHLYLRAEFDNFRKNAIKERSELIKYGVERFVRELLDVVDTFEMALSAEVSPQNLESFIKGIELTSSNLKNLLNRFGIQEIDPIGDDFDPAVHEALSSEPTDEFPPGKVCRVFKKAYKLHDKLIRPAQVVVATEREKSGGGHNGNSGEAN